MCEYAIEVTNGSKETNVVPIGVRQPLLQTWVLAKQMAQQQIPKTLGADEEVRGQMSQKLKNKDQNFSSTFLFWFFYLMKFSKKKLIDNLSVISYIGRWYSYVITICQIYFLCKVVLWLYFTLIFSDYLFFSMKFLNHLFHCDFFHDFFHATIKVSSSESVRVHSIYCVCVWPCSHTLKVRDRWPGLLLQWNSCMSLGMESWNSKKHPMLLRYYEQNLTDIPPLFKLYTCKAYRLW